MQLVVAAALVLGFATRSDAGAITLAWDPSPIEDVAGYVVLYGTTPGTYPYALGVGNHTSATVSGLAGGQLYYFVVQAYSSSDVLGAPQPSRLRRPEVDVGSSRETLPLPVASICENR